MRRRKYGNKKTEVDGIVFDSQKEANRYCELKLLEHQGVIADLELQPKYELCVGGVKVCDYKADFRYMNSSGGRTVEDVKGGEATKTPVYRLKKKLMLAVHGI